jgi:hypothetical protein
MLGRSLSLATVAAALVAGVPIWACSSSTATIPEVDAGSPVDAAPVPDDSPSGATPEASAGINITYGQCPAFTKCGGDIVGSWHLTGGCLSEQTFAQAKSICPQLKESNVSLHATGSLDVTATNIQRETAVNLSAHIELPKSCDILAPSATCTDVSNLLMNPLIFPGGFSFKTATCVDSTTDAKLCECDVTTSYSESIDTTYTATPDGSLTTPPATGSSSPRTYEFCIASAALTFTETTQSQPLRFFATLAKD